MLTPQEREALGLPSLATSEKEREALLQLILRLIDVTVGLAVSLLPILLRESWSPSSVQSGHDADTRSAPLSA